MTINSFSTSLISENYVAPLRSESVKFHLFGKRILLLAMGICFSLFVNAQVSKTINIIAGNLSSALTATELQTVTNLTLTGTIDARDFKTMRDLMPVLAEINISEVTIVAYVGREGTAETSVVFPANTIPTYAFRDYLADGKTTLSSIQLPESITALGDYCFMRCTGLTSIAIPSSVISIGNHAFFGCIGLTSIAIPSSVITIGNYAFYGCVELSTVPIPQSVTSIGAYAFGKCEKLNSFVIPSSVTSIEEGTFSKCISLSTVTIPSSVTSIGKLAFATCIYLTSITIPSSVTSFGDKAFFSCIRLSSVIIPSSVTSIGFRVFEGCGALIEVDENNQTYSSLDSVLYDKSQSTLIQCFKFKSGTVTIPETVTTINKYAFKGCSNLKTVFIPSSVTSIGEEAFYYSSIISIVIPPTVKSIAKSTFTGCYNLTSVTIPNSVDSIGDFAFSYCNVLQKVVIPPSVKTIGNSAFEDCVALGSISIPPLVNSIGSMAFSGCSGVIDVDVNNPYFSSLNSVIYNKDKTRIVQCPSTKTGKFVIPSSVTSIENSAFWDCKYLTSISIPASVISIDGGAFSYCYGLTSLIAANPIPIDLTSINYVFRDINQTTCTLYVPVGSKSAYQVAEVWKDFTKIVEDPKIPTGLEPIINEKQLTAYPNPTIGRVKLIIDQIPQNETYLTVTDVTGRMILKQIIREKEEWIDLTGNPPGIYLINTNLENSKVEKVILK